MDDGQDLDNPQRSVYERRIRQGIPFSHLLPRACCIGRRGHADLDRRLRPEQKNCLDEKGFGHRQRNPRKPLGSHGECPLGGRGDLELDPGTGYPSC